MAVFAKSISNGYPMGAVVGKRDVMEPSGRMFISSTYWSDTIGLRAALTTIQELRRRDVPAQLDRLGRTIQDRLNAVARGDGAAGPVRGDQPSTRGCSSTWTTRALQATLATLYIQEMAKRGCHGYASFYLNAAQGDARGRAQTEAAAREVFAVDPRRSRHGPNRRAAGV